jgi:DNA modification methylase
MLYENTDLSWMGYYWNEVLDDNGIMAVQTDWHTNYLVRARFESFENGNFVNHAVVKGEWGNHPKRNMHQCFDDIIIFSKGKKYKFFPEKIQVPKATAKTKLNPSGRETKTATAWIDDVCLTTTSKERVKKEDGGLIKWQKALKLFDRITAPFVEEGDWVLDPFMGSGSLGEYCLRNKLNYIGVEYDKETFLLAQKRIDNVYAEMREEFNRGVMDIVK